MNIFEKAVKALELGGYTQHQVLEIMNLLNRKEIFLADAAIHPEYKSTDEKAYVPSTEKMVSYTITTSVPLINFSGVESTYNAMSSAHRDLVIAHGVEATFSVYHVEVDNI
jgi:hypothetical protein